MDQDKIRNYPDGQIYDVITNGSGLMPAYKWPIPPHDRPTAGQSDTPPPVRWASAQL